MVPEQRVRTCSYQVCRMVPKQVAYTVTRCVPKIVYREVPCEPTCAAEPSCATEPGCAAAPACAAGDE